MRRLPDEFEDLLSRRGLAVLSRRLRAGLAGGATFSAETGLLDARRARSVRDLLDRTLRDVLTPMADPIPDWTITGMQHDYGELLPKAVRVKTATFSSRRSRAFARARDLNLHAMLASASYRAFAEALAGRPLKRGHGTQVLCYGPGDYAGPHNDHHPEDPAARGGYTDVHLTFCTDAVRRQTLVAARDGHFTDTSDVATVGGVTCYRLPFWHYVNPLEARRGRERDARRWVVLGTFLDQPPR
ncbi:MAG: hypothetical protein INH41_05860 [Myxococcaceae bacterium]|jgi:hypothetical protein|nr:hypothetical protein [Myxococcaceae bacterium]MCA3011911.1 hypothetical protein [Myxococcaceae bacterium]